MPSYDLTCLKCERKWERFSRVADRYAPCETCGGAVAQRFAHSVQATPFSPYFDYGLGMEIGSFAERWTAMRRAGMQYRDLPSKGDLSARIDRIHEQRRDATR